MNEVEFAVKLVGGAIAAMAGYVIWVLKSLRIKVDNTFTKAEVQNIVDLKLGEIKAELSSLRASDTRLEAQLVRLETKIDTLILEIRRGE